MANIKCKTFIFKKQFDGYIKEDNFELIEEEISPVKDGEYIAESLYLSVDPYMRVYAKTWLKVGVKMIATGIGRVISSKNDDYPVGTIITGGFGWTTHIKFNKDSHKQSGFHRKVREDISLSHAMGVFSLTGITAYAGLIEICNPQPGETLFVNAAAGATGNVVGQIGKIKGCRVVGCAGSDEKVKYLKEIGFDGAFNYKTVENYEATLKELCPNGIDCFFENVGGDQFEAVLNQMNRFGRIAVCGAISTYNISSGQPAPRGPMIHMHAISKELKIQGFLVPSYASKFSEIITQLITWQKEGKIVVREHIVEGFENLPKALMSLFTGDNIGKCSVKITS